MFRNKKNQAPRYNSGQSTVEYIILVAAVIGVVILFMNGPSSLFQQRLGKTYNQVGDKILNKMTTLVNSEVTTADTPAAAWTSPTTINPTDTNPQKKFSL